MAKSSEEFEDISQVEVKLKPFLGIKPGLYLTVLYSAGALLLLFLLLFLPGIKKDGIIYSFTSTPSGAAVFTDGLYTGSTPVRAFVARGSHTVSFSRPFFTALDIRLDTGGRLFGSLFFPKKVDITTNLVLSDSDGFLEGRLREISQWALINQFGPSYQPPRLISSTVADFYVAGDEDDVAVDQFLEAALASINGEVFLGDYLRALFFREGKGHASSADVMVGVARRVASLVSKYPSLALLLSALLEPEATVEYRQSSWFSGLVDAYREMVTSYSDAGHQVIRDERMIAGMPFVRVPAGSFVMGASFGSSTSIELPHPVATPEVYMLKGEVTRDSYARFLDSNPEWRPARVDDLVARGLVDENYLYDWEEEIAGELPVAYISYHAAKAFARWFGESLPAAWQSFATRLPTEAEWEWAARLYATESELKGAIGSDGPLPVEGVDGVEHLLGSLWEWCDTWYHPADYFVKPWEAEVHLPGGAFDLGAEAVVRGGSWANNEDDRVGVSSRGSQPPEWCTPFTGFRIILVGK